MSALKDRKHPLIWVMHSINMSYHVLIYQLSTHLIESLFSCFAPDDNPKRVVVINLEPKQWASPWRKAMVWPPDSVAYLCLELPSRSWKWRKDRLNAIRMLWEWCLTRKLIKFPLCHTAAPILGLPHPPVELLEKHGWSRGTNFEHVSRCYLHLANHLCGSEVIQIKYNRMKDKTDINNITVFLNRQRFHIDVQY